MDQSFDDGFVEPESFALPASCSGAGAVPGVAAAALFLLALFLLPDFFRTAFLLADFFLVVFFEPAPLVLSFEAPSDALSSTLVAARPDAGFLVRLPRAASSNESSAAALTPVLRM